MNIIYVSLSFLCPNLHKEGHYEMMGGVCLSISTCLQVKRSKVKDTRPINAVTDNAPYAG